ncbi:MAG: aminodeoxychorismate synthase component I [Acidimicrobiia bacterium]
MRSLNVMYGAQFDDAETRSTVVLSEPVEAIEAKALDDVPDALEAVASAARQGRWVAGYVTYDAAPAFDRSLEVPGQPDGPYAWFGVFGRADTLSSTTHERAPQGAYSVSRWSPAIERSEYEGAFKVVRDHIRDGDTYQVNLTFPLRAAFNGDAAALYGDLMHSQRARYGAHIWHDETHVISASPERFFRVDGRRITTRPMKGTRPRGRWLEEDAALAAELAASEKDRAENLMIVDLIRNDLGRIAEFGSVDVEELFAIEKYPTVWQMTSQISAELSDAIELGDVFHALFPCGSVTGAPKPRSTEIISEVEHHARGPYCGAIGLVPPGDGLDGATFNVAIRTAVLNAEEGIASYHVGGGVIWDSSADDEYDEALTKALVLSSRPSPEGVFESIRWDGEYVWLDEHLARLRASASFLGIDVAIDAIASGLTALEQVLTAPTKVRVTASSAGPRIDTDPAPARFRTKPGVDAGPVHVAIDFDPIERTDIRWYHKTTDRSRYVIRMKRHADADEVLLTNDHGNVTEGTFTNIAVLLDGEWLTPPIEDGLLPGVMRAQLLRDGTVVEGSISAAELPSSDAIAVFNSVRGWRSAVLVASYGVTVGVDG